MNIPVPWNTLIPPTIDLSTINPACTTGNCSTACTNVTTLFGSASQPSNMYACMRYQEISVNMSNGTYNDSELAYFSELGIRDAKEAPDIVTTVAKLISGCFTEYCEVSDNGCIGAFTDQFDVQLGLESLDENASGPFGMFCTMEWLLNGTTGLLEVDLASQCFVDICTPATTTNPDIAGIGVFASMVIQFAIASGIMVFSMKPISKKGGTLRVFLMDIRCRNNNEKGSVDKQETQTHSSASFYTATVEFHKAQCYFSYAIQIASLADLVRLIRNQNIGDQSSIRRVLACLLPPILITLFSINLSGKCSWYLTFLSMLSVIFTASIYGLMGHISTLSVFVEPLDMAFAACGGPAPIVANPCPSWRIGQLDTDGWDSFHLSLMVSLIWLHLVLLRHLVDRNDQGVSSTSWRMSKRRRYNARERIRSWKLYFGSKTMIPYSRALSIFSRILVDVFVVALILTTEFAAIWELISIVVDSSGTQFATWGFGQIVAVLVWVPCLVEWLNLWIRGQERGSDYRLQAPFRVTSDPPLMFTSPVPASPKSIISKVETSDVEAHAHGALTSDSPVIATDEELAGSSSACHPDQISEALPHANTWH